MKSSIESNGKEHKVILIAENVFEQAIINAVQIFQTKANIYKLESKPLKDNEAGIKILDALVIEMKDGD